MSALVEYWKMRALFAEKALAERRGREQQEHQEGQGNNKETAKPRWIAVARMPDFYKP